LTGTTTSYPSPIGDFGISQEQLSEITMDHNHDALVEIGGVSLPQVFLLDLYMILLLVSYFSCLYHIR